MSIIKENRYSTTLFRVQVFSKNNVLEEEVYCIGTNDINQFVQKKREEIGIESYSGYKSQAVNLSKYSKSIIKKGVSCFDM